MTGIWRRQKIVTVAAYIFLIALVVIIATNMTQSSTDNYMDFVHAANVTVLENKFIHKHKYQLTINNDSICDRNTFLLILVNTDPENRNSRNLIRKTWGSVKEYKGIHIRSVFLMGARTSYNAGQAAVLTANIVNESSTYGDIARGDFIDDYFNMTYKTVMGLYWMSEYCPEVPFVMKVDDDAMINIYKLVDFLQKANTTENLGNFYYGLTFTVPPVRSNSSKWQVIYADYKYSWYPPYCAGLGYILSNQAAMRIYHATSKVPFFWIDDVFIGFCAELSNIKPIHHYFGYYVIDKLSVDASWEYTIVKEFNRTRPDLSRTAWAYINSIREYRGLSYVSIRYMRYILICLCACLLVCFVAVAKRMHKSK